jgi:hypothetical protein
MPAVDAVIVAAIVAAFVAFAGVRASNAGLAAHPMKQPMFLLARAAAVP